MLTINIKTAAILFCMSLCPALPSQTQDYRNAIDISYSSLRFQPHEQYLGVGVDYRLIVRPTFQLKIELTDFPGWQSTIQSDSSGRQMIDFNGSVLAGHRWNRLSLLAEAGAGTLSASTLTNAATQSGVGSGSWATQHYPELLLGGMVEARVSDHLGLFYEVRDNLGFIRSSGNTHTLNIPGGRFGLSYRFERIGETNSSDHSFDLPADKTSTSPHSIHLIYSTLHWSPYPQYAGQQWLGLGLRYRYMGRRPLGVQLEGTYFPQAQTYSSQQVVQAAVTGLAGHRWGRIGLYGETGIGVLRMHLYGALSRQNMPLYLWSDYPELPIGGTAEVRIGKGWVFTYEVRDNVVFVGAAQFIGPAASGYGPIGPPTRGFVANLFQASSGLSLHF